MLNENRALTDAEAARRYAGELADCRILLDNCQVARDAIAAELEQRDKEVATLRRIVTSIYELSDDNETVRAMCEDVLLGEVPK